MITTWTASFSTLWKDNPELDCVDFCFTFIFEDLGQTCPSFRKKQQQEQLPSQQTKPGKKWAREPAEELHKLLELKSPYIYSFPSRARAWQCFRDSHHSELVLNYWNLGLRDFLMPKIKKTMFVRTQRCNQWRRRQHLCWKIHHLCLWWHERHRKFLRVCDTFSRRLAFEARPFTQKTACSFSLVTMDSSQKWFWLILVLSEFL